MTDVATEQPIGPIDYLVVAWPQHKVTGEPFNEIVKLVDAGLVRILDLAFVRKQLTGEVVAVTWEEVADGVAEIAVFEGASSGLIAADDYADLAGALLPEEAAAILIYENVWAAPLADAIRRSGGQLVSTERIPLESILAELDELDAEAAELEAEEAVEEAEQA